jgi:uncharacterized protein YdhG (YjbR/CyaY superfamily)
MERLGGAGLSPIAMKPIQNAPATVDAYISAFSPEVQRLLQKVRQAARAAAPEAEEVISYRMPALKQNGMLVYFAAFKHHIGLYPPVRGDLELENDVKPFAGEKGNLRFPIDQPIPYELVTRITGFRLKQNMAKAMSRRKTARRSPL